MISSLVFGEYKLPFLLPPSIDSPASVQIARIEGRYRNPYNESCAMQAIWKGAFMVFPHNGAKYVGIVDMQNVTPTASLHSMCSWVYMLMGSPLQHGLPSVTHVADMLSGTPCLQELHTQCRQAIERKDNTTCMAWADSHK